MALSLSQRGDLSACWFKSNVTGLGLSLSYDIITKGYDGLLTLENNAEGGTTFLIRLSTDSASSSIKP
ncbi:hypothetical protein G8759_31695 [Spirosoma aureum]|uniref:Uncharacterized protein n=1 Tax=Spirosoma aureum TaxID=2692134 RepID=A0A6G9AWT6_9BACT|nr:hypothetical protein [Spirosoma aureum]QIP16880.1 hypothetical protein G8759_31695 [Spirosoma aureum]